MKKQVVIAILILLQMGIYAQEKMETFVKGDFSIMYPKLWTVDASGRMNSEVIFFSPMEVNDTFQENVNILLQDLTGQNIDLKEYIDISIQQVKNAAKDYTIEKNEVMIKDGIQYGILVWNGNVTGSPLKFKQIVREKDQKFFIVTFTSLPEKYEQFISTADKMLESFKLKQ